MSQLNKKINITIVAFLVPALARPQESQGPGAQSGSTPIPIISQTDEINPDGSFKFSYETGNGIKVEESGYIKDGNESSTDKIQVIQGSVSYTNADGKVISLKYIADENGFQPEGDHLPTPPSLPGAAASSLKALPDQKAAQSAPQPAVPEPRAPEPAVPQPTPQLISQNDAQESTTETQTS
ncbi:hypothetical protein NQ318_008288 [Aromia moschata]|uniref:Uncharacterized protein n=1 Tax=Aromia moschata TaxID=1265417 RepID=A0AAV8XFC6_9CUCU|nr:hypothetical protein NQ318_008288 [Aromia moschata]